MKREITALIEREGDRFVGSCPSLDLSCQGSTMEEARNNLIEALKVFFEQSSGQEVFDEEMLITRVTV